MIKNSLAHKQALILFACLTAVCILFLGMRVPDFSRPQRPKPTHRAFIEKQVKQSQQAVKKTLEFVAIPAEPAEPAALLTIRTQRLFSFQATDFPPLFPNLSRAPPSPC